MVEAVVGIEWRAKTTYSTLYVNICVLFFLKEFKIKRIYRKVVLIQFNTSIHNDPSGQEPSTVDIKSLFVDNIRSTSK